MALTEIRAAVAPYLLLIRLGLWLLLAGVLVFGGCRWQGKRDARAIAEAQAEAATLQAALAEAQRLTQQAQAKAKAASEQAAAASAAADTKLKETTDEANRNAADLAAALRTGERRLRDLWACRAADGDAGSAAADAGQADAAGRADSAGRIAGAVAADAALIDWLYDRWQADRQAVIAAGCAVVADEGT